MMKSMNNYYLFNISRYGIGIGFQILSIYFTIDLFLMAIQSACQKEMGSVAIELFFSIAMAVLSGGLIRNWNTKGWRLVYRRGDYLYSRLFQKKCTVDLNKPVYYATIWQQWGPGLPDRIIVISNYPFPIYKSEKLAESYYQNKDNYLFRNDFDNNKQILVYYTAFSKKHLPLDKWKPLNEPYGPKIWL